MTHKEIAKAEGMSEAQVRRLEASALNRMRKACKEHGITVADEEVLAYLLDEVMAEAIRRKCGGG
jgi:hypothetical protein